MRVPGRATPALVLGAWAAALLHWTWLAWPNVLVDVGRDLYVAWQLSEGARLYADVEHLNGPLSPWWNALVFRVLGPGIPSIVSANLAIGAGIVALLYRVLARIGDRGSATFACAVFLVLFGFADFNGFGNYNYVTPYAHEMTHGLLLGLAAIACLDVWARGRRSGWLVAAGLALGLAFLTKPELFAACACASAAGLAVSASPRARPALLLLGAAALPPLLALGLLAARMPFAVALDGVLGGWSGVVGPGVGRLRFYQSAMGTDRVGASLLRMAAWALCVAALLGAAAWLGRRLASAPGRARAAAVAIFCAGVALGLGLRERIPWSEVAVAYPVGLAALLVALVRRSPAQGESGARALAIVFLVFSSALLGKILLNAHLGHYGFVLAAPATCALIVAGLAWGPRALERAGADGTPLRALVLALVLTVALVYGNATRTQVAAKGWVVRAGADALRTQGMFGRHVDRVLRDLEVRLADGGTLLVLPDGAMLNFLLRRRNPTPYTNFMPPEVMVFGEERILAAFETHPPDAVVLVHRDTAEYGARFFGSDYGQRLMGFVRGRYATALRSGGPPLRPGTLFGVEVLVPRRPAEPPAAGR